MIAPSELGAGLGLYTTAAIKIGAIVLSAASPPEHWCAVDGLQSISLKHSLCINLHQTFRKPTRMICQGDPSRYAWPYINSAKHTSNQPNLKIVTILGDMDDSFASFVALRDIQEFHELLFDYEIKPSVAAVPTPNGVAHEEGAAQEEMVGTKQEVKEDQEGSEELFDDAGYAAQEAKEGLLLFGCCCF